MNVFVYALAEGHVEPAPDVSPRKLVVEDNVGESIHVHLRNLRLELPVAEFDALADDLVAAREALADGHR